METMQKTKNEITEGVIWKQLLLFFFPILLGTFFQQLYNTIDSVIVGQFVGKEALASVGGSSAQIVSLVIGFFTGLSSGAAVTIAQFVGARKEKTANAGLHNAFAIAAAGGIALTLIGILAAPFMLRLMNTPAETMDGSLTYLRIYFAGILFVLVYNMGSAILRATGDSKTPLYILIVCCIVNIILDTAFVLLFHMGVTGVAIATLLAQAVSAVLVTLKLTRSKGILCLSLRKIRFHGPLLSMQLKLGLPTGFESILFAITNIAIQSAINTFGTDTTAAWSAFGKLDAIFWMISTAFGISITTFVGQNYGAGKSGRIREGIKKAVLMSVGFCLVISLLVFIFARPLMTIFVDPSETKILAAGVEYLRIEGAFYCGIGCLFLLYGLYRAIKRPGMSVVLTIFSLGTRVVLAYGLSAIDFIGVTGIWWSVPIGWALADLVGFLYYKKNKKKLFTKI